jgi:molybdopterin-guanine dinucleotide biosynthesis protein A
VADIRPDFQGPLAGLEAAMPYVHTDLLVISACDTPLLPTDLVERLIRPLRENEGLDITYAHDGERGHYLCAAMRAACLPTLSVYLDEGHRTVRHWYHRHPSITVDFRDQAQAFNNHNRPG